MAGILGLGALSATTKLIAAAVVVGVIGGALLGAYMKGRSDGEAVEKAAYSDANGAAVKQFNADVKASIDSASHQAFADFNARLDQMQAIATQLDKDHGVIHDNAQALAGLVRGRFTLTPVVRQRVECLRRPDAAGCAAAPVRNPVP